MEARDLLLVYGTLRKDAGYPMHDVLCHYADFVGTGCFAGRLYDLGKFPGAVSQGGASLVRGEVYAMRDAAALFGVLDPYEGQSFRRRKLTVSLDGGSEVSCWVYLYVGLTAGFGVIESGDYVKFLKG